MARLTPAVIRTLDILELLAEGSLPLSAPEIVRRTELPRTSVHELLKTLTAREYLEQDPATNTYRLGPRVLQLGNAYSARFDMLATANTIARSVSTRCDETVSVAIREGGDVFYLAKVEPRDPLRLPSHIGQRLPASSTALGKALLAYVSPEAVNGLFSDPLPALTENSIRSLDSLKRELELVRETGVATEVEESAPGIRCVAAPIRDGHGAVVAAISLSLPVDRWRLRPSNEWTDYALAGAQEFSQMLGFSYT